MARYNTKFLQKVWNEDAQDYKNRWVELKAFSLNNAIKEFNRGISSRRFKGDEPFVFTLNMREMKEDIGGTYVFNSQQAKLSNHLAKEVLKTVTKLSYPYTPVKDYTEEMRKYRETHDGYLDPAYTQHKHLYENVTLAKVKTGAVPRYGLSYQAQAIHPYNANRIQTFGNKGSGEAYAYGARQYYGEEVEGRTWNRDKSIHPQSRGRWLEPLASENYLVHYQFINSNRRYVEKEAIKLAKAAMRGKVK